MLYATDDSMRLYGAIIFGTAFGTLVLRNINGFHERTTNGRMFEKIFGGAGRLDAMTSMINLSRELLSEFHGIAVCIALGKSGLVYRTDAMERNVE